MTVNDLLHRASSMELTEWAIYLGKIKDETPEATPEQQLNAFQMLSGKAKAKR